MVRRKGMKALTTVTIAVGPVAGTLPAGGTNGPVLITAGDLNVGDQVALEGNRVGVVTGTITTRRETDVFNLSVDGDHTFLVTPTPQSADGRINPARGPQRSHPQHQLRVGEPPAKTRGPR